MGGPWQISAGDVSETLRPAFFALSVLASAWVLSDARRHDGFHPWAVWAWTLSAFLFPPVVLPLYLVARMFTRRAVSNVTTSESVQSDSPEDESRPADEKSADEQITPPGGTPRGWRFARPVLYALALLVAGAVYFYQDYQSFDAHLARAARAKLYGRRERVIGEYRAALRTEDDAHTHKLLGLELLEAGRAEEALAELRAAVWGGEPDERLHFHVAALLESLNRPDEAATSYKRFLDSLFCLTSTGDSNCLRARERLGALTHSADH